MVKEIGVDNKSIKFIELSCSFAALQTISESIVFKSIDSQLLSKQAAIILLKIHLSQEPLTIKEIRCSLSMEENTINYHLNKLKLYNFIDVHRDDNDHRLIRVEVNKNAIEMLDKAKSNIGLIINPIDIDFNKLDEEITLYKKILSAKNNDN